MKKSEYRRRNEHISFLTGSKILLLIDNDVYALILGNPGLQRGWEEKGETGSGEKGGVGEGKGKGKGEALGSFSVQIISHYFSEPLLASFLIKFKMRPMKSDY